MKWLPLEKKYDIYQKALLSNADIKKKNIKAQEDLVDNVFKNIESNTNPTAELQEASR